MTLDIDFGKTAGDYSQYRAGFPDELFERLTGFGIGLAGQQILDLGTGTGTLGGGFALRGAAVIGLDRSRRMLLAAREKGRDQDIGMSFVNAVAESAPFARASFDAVSAGQCWHWFDRIRVAGEVRRLLVPGGWLVIAHFDWLPLPGNVVEATEQLILAHNPAWAGAGGDGIHRAWLADVSLAGFTGIETFTFDQRAPYSHKAWRGRIRASAGVAASLAPEQVAAFDSELHELLKRRFAVEPLMIPHRVFALVCRSP